MTDWIPKILIVDDDPRNVKLLSRILISQGYGVIEAFCGEDAIDIAREDPPDLILLDVMMPGLDGYRVCEILRQDERLKPVPIVMVTALAGKEDKAKSLESGADDFITKPFQRFEILARVRSSLRVKKLHDELMLANKELEHKNQLFEEELMTARELQNALMIHDPPRIDGVSFGFRNIPTFTVGGDLLYVQAVSEACLGVFISDVMGHGPQAAMIAAIIRTILSDSLRDDPKPSDLLFQMNRRFCTVMPRGYQLTFASAIYMRLNARTGELLVSNAGHPQPFILRRSDRKVDLLDANTSLALGLSEASRYQDVSILLKEGDGVLLYTDGMFEARNERGELFGMDRLRKSVIAGIDLAPQELVDSLISDVWGFAGRDSTDDDLTGFCLNYKTGG